MELCLQSSEESMFKQDKCIICQRDSKHPLTSSDNGRRKGIEAAELRRDIVYQRLLQNGGEF